MKKTIITLLLLALVKFSMGQLQLSGTITGANKTDVVELAYPFDSSYQGTYNQVKPMRTILGANGAFKFNLKSAQPQFMVLCYKGVKNYLLLLPGKPLSVVIKNNKLSTANAENKLLLNSALNDTTFIINRLSDYKKQSGDSLVNIMVPLVNTELNATLAGIEQLHTSTQTKGLLKTELKYSYANKLSKFSDNIMQKAARQAPWKILADAVVGNNPLPAADALQNSPAANTYLHYYALHYLKDFTITIKEDRTRTKEIVEQQTGLPVDTAMKLGNEFGEDYLSALVAKRNLPPYAYQKLLLNMFLQYSANKDLKFAKRLQADFAANFANSSNLKTVNLILKALQQDITEAEKNKNIVFVNTSEKTTTLEQLLAPYKGKIVYLDFWGTWCDPCMQEIINHSAPLKQRFKDKDVVFLYLEMDYNYANDEIKWKQFARLHNMMGYHVRMNREQIEKIWVDLLHTEKVARLYPTYAIFDRQGNAINKNAKKPSDGEALYKDLEAALNK